MIRQISSRTPTWVLLVTSATITTAFCLPLIELPFGVRLSLLDLEAGALTGGRWTLTRILLGLLFAASISAFIFSAAKVLRARLRRP